MECNFVIGQKVVCVNDNEDEFKHTTNDSFDEERGLDGLEKGRVYTIRDITLDVTTNYIVVFLNEIHRKFTWDGSYGEMTEPGYHHARFAPLKEKKTDISIFNSIVNKINAGDHDNNYGYSLDELYETVKQ